MTEAAASERRPVPADEARLIAAAKAGDEVAFSQLTERYRAEIHLHCYRMLGSFVDAEDFVQDTLLRAWRGMPSFGQRASFRGWLYKIATNVCLKALAKRKRQLISTSIGPPATVGEMPAPPVAEVVRLQPYPDALLDASADADPAAEYIAREGVELAFIAAIQHLTPRQRAVSILRDVLGWSAAETAQLLEMTVAAANSSLQRSRTALENLGQRPASTAALSNDVERSLLKRYVDAWHSADVDGLVALLREDAVMTMPPSPTWYLGREAIGVFFAALVSEGQCIYGVRLIETRANRQPALAGYRADADGVFRPYGLMVLTIDAASISQISGFLEPALFPGFQLPPTLAA